MQKKNFWLKATPKLICVFFVILLGSSNACAGSKRRPGTNPNAPGTNLEVWAYNPTLQSFVSTFNGKQKVINAGAMMPEQVQFVKGLVMIPADHFNFFVTLFQTGCKDWSDMAHKRAREFNAENPDLKLMLEISK